MVYTRDMTTTYAMYLHESDGWRQFAFTNPDEAERMVNGSTGRVVAVDTRTGKVVLASKAKDLPKP